MGDQFEAVLSLAAEWAENQEELILRNGSPLSRAQMADARAVGIREPNQIRLLLIDQIPTPPGSLLQAASNEIALLPRAASGLTLRYGVFIRRDRRQDRHLLVHELVHTSQYERLGGIVPFLIEYLNQCATVGYSGAPLECEAEQIAAQICGA